MQVRLAEKKFWSFSVGLNGHPLAADGYSSWRLLA